MMLSGLSVVTLGNLLALLPLQKSSEAMVGIIMSCQNVYRWTILTIEEDLLYRSGGLARLVPEGQLGSGDVVGPSRY